MEIDSGGPRRLGWRRATGGILGDTEGESRLLEGHVLALEAVEEILEVLVLVERPLVLSLEIGDLVLELKKRSGKRLCYAS